MVIVSNDGFVYRWDMTTFTKKGEGLIDRNCDFKASLFWDSTTVGKGGNHIIFKYNQY